MFKSLKATIEYFPIRKTIFDRKCFTAILFILKLFFKESPDLLVSHNIKINAIV